MVKEFTSDWDWNSVFYAWSDRIADFCITLNPLFTEIHAFDSEIPTGREIKYSWWPTNSIRELHLNLQRHLDNFPGTRSPIHPPVYYIRRGEIDTLRYLWENKDDPERVAAVLIMASLFARLYNSRKGYPNEWPHYFCVEELYKWAYEKCFGAEKGHGWHTSCTEVLPVSNSDYHYTIRNMEALIRHLAEEHALVLINYKPISIIFGPEQDPFIEKILAQESEVHEKSKREYEKHLKEQRVKAREEQNRLKKEHPRWGEWGNISDKELKTLVWTKSTVKLAKEFGVSDVAIAKRCRFAGIPKPPPGFWAKVEADLIPHPKGKVPKEMRKKDG